MTDKATAKLKASGWTTVESSGFISLVGPLWQRIVNGEHEYAIVAQDKHHNRRGLVQGGELMTFADRPCGMTARYVSGKPMLATVQLDTHFVEPGKIGEILVSKPHVVRDPQPDLHHSRGDRRQALYRHGQRRVQDIEERVRAMCLPRHCEERSDEAIHSFFAW